MPLPSTIETRLYAEQVPEWQRFQANPKGGDGAQHPYQRQYAHVYHQRLAQIGPRIWKRLKEEEEDSITHVQRILELPEDQRCACVGTLVVERALKISTTSALEEADDEDALISSLNDTSPKNDASYYLEDESGRVALNLTSYWNKSSTTTEATDFCTGLVLGLIGIVGGADGVLTVERVVPAASVQTISPSPVVVHPVRAPQVLLLSGLECGSPHASSLPRDMLLSYLQGLFPHANSQASAIVHIIIAGGLVYHPTAEGEDITTTANGCRDLDAFLYQLTRVTGIPVSILPGQKDPTTANWPQRPLHPSLIPVVASNPSLLSRCPNPYAATLVWNDDNERRTTICGSDGLNVADFMQQTNADALSALQATLMHYHICPTGPSSVPTAPHTETDPMVLPSPPPHVYFAGNCPRLQTRLVQTDETACRLVCLPKFIDTGLAVLVHLQSLNVEALRFAIE